MVTCMYWEKKLKNNTCKICWKSLCSGILLFGSFVSLSHLMCLQRDTVFAIPNNTQRVLMMFHHGQRLQAYLIVRVSFLPQEEHWRGTLFQGGKKKEDKAKNSFQGPNCRLCLSTHPTLPLIIRTFNASYGLGTKVAVEVSHFQKNGFCPIHLWTEGGKPHR